MRITRTQIIPLMFSLLLGCSDEPLSQDSVPVPPEQKLDAHLLDLAKIHQRQGDPGVTEHVKQTCLVLENGTLPGVIVVTSEEELVAVQEALQDLEGEVVTQLDNRLYARIPVGSIMKLAPMKPVWTLSLSQQVAYPMTENTGDDTRQPVTNPADSELPESNPEEKP